ncbi:hypothetical protein ACOZ4I_13195 [Haloarcula salina]|uniref:hypothetical protein n=1 Tax=Haloarcula salina TaxID=1429914 RepID=UPI003C6EFB5A
MASWTVSPLCQPGYRSPHRTPNLVYEQLRSVQFAPSLGEHPLIGVTFALTALIFVGNLAAMGYWARAEAEARNGSVFWTFVILSSGFGQIYDI